MYDILARRAISAALANDWNLALAANLEILKEEENDIDALNRASRAYLQLGDVQNAILLSKKAIELDPLNTIAQKCFAKCHAFQENGTYTFNTSQVSDNIFLEVPGKTKIVSLVNLCESTILARLDAGINVQMNPKMHKVMVTTFEEIYIGRLPDDIATRMIYFYKNGNEYDAYIKSVSDDEVKIFIREIKRSDALSHLSSFPLR